MSKTHCLQATNINNKFFEFPYLPSSASQNNFLVSIMPSASAAIDDRSPTLRLWRYLPRANQKPPIHDKCCLADQKILQKGKERKIMRSSSERINIAAIAQRLDVDNRIAIRYYYRIADNILKQVSVTLAWFNYCWAELFVVFGEFYRIMFWIVKF